MSSPPGVPGPTLVNFSFSSWLIVIRKLLFLVRQLAVIPCNYVDPVEISLTSYPQRESRVIQPKPGRSHAAIVGVIIPDPRLQRPMVIGLGQKGNHVHLVGDVLLDIDARLPA